MRDAGIDGNHKIQVCDDCCRIVKVRDLVIESQNLADILQRRIVQGADFLLETDERRVDLEKRF